MSPRDAFNCARTTQRSFLQMIDGNSPQFQKCKQTPVDLAEAWTWLQLQKPRHLPSNRKKQTANEEDGDVSLVFCDAFKFCVTQVGFAILSAIGNR